MKIKKMNLKKEENKYYQNDRKWKEENKKYLIELQMFFDKVEEIKDVNLRQRVINQMLQCDKVLTEIAEEKFFYCYEEGYQKAKDE